MIELSLGAVFILMSGVLFGRWYERGLARRRRRAGTAGMPGSGT